VTAAHDFFAPSGSRTSVRWLRINLPPAEVRWRSAATLDADMPFVACDLAEREAELRAAFAVPADDASICLQRGRAR